MKVETIIGTDNAGKDFLAVFRSVYRIEGLAENGNPIGSWVSELTPFLATGVKRYSITIDTDALDQHYRLLDVVLP